MIEPIVKEINDKTDIKISFETRRTGRQVSHIKFKYKFKSKEAEKALLPKPKKSNRKTAIKQNKFTNTPGRQPGETDVQYMMRTGNSITKQ